MSSARPDSRTHDASARRVYLILAAATVVATGIMLAVTQLHRSLARRYAPLQRAERIEFELTAAHLWLEELLAGDAPAGIDDVRGHLDRAAADVAWLRTSLHGRSAAIDDPSLRDPIPQLVERLAEFRQAAEHRWQNRTAARQARRDESFDDQFRHLMSLTAAVKTETQAMMGQQAGQDAVLRVLIVASIIAAGRRRGPCVPALPSPPPAGRKGSS